MLFWLILHSLQLFGAEAADAGFSGKKWTLSCRRRTPPNYLKIDGGCFPEGSRRHAKELPEGGHRVPMRPPGVAPTLAAPGGRLDPRGHSRLPPLAYVRLVIQKTLKRESFRSSAAAPWRKPTEKKSHLWRADSAGEITSWKGRSSPSSSPSSRASSRSSSTPSPSSAPSPPPSNLISQLQLVL